MTGDRCQARRWDWASRLADCVEVARGRPFRWGEHDCCLFTCDCVAAMTGTDPGVAFRETYGDEAGARRALRRFAGGGLAAVAARLARLHGYEEVPPVKAGRGDVVLLSGAGAGPDGLGVCVGSCALVATPAGLRAVPARFWRRAWKI